MAEKFERIWIEDAFLKKKKTARIWAEGGGHEDVKVVAKGDFKAGAWKGWEGWCHRQQMV